MRISWYLHAVVCKDFCNFAIFANYLSSLSSRGTILDLQFPLTLLNLFYTFLVRVLAFSELTKFCHVTSLAFLKILYLIALLLWNDLSLVLFFGLFGVFCTLLFLFFPPFHILHFIMPLIILSLFPRWFFVLGLCHHIKKILKSTIYLNRKSFWMIYLVCQTLNLKKIKLISLIVTSK